VKLGSCQVPVSPGVDSCQCGCFSQLAVCVCVCVTRQDRVLATIGNIISIYFVCIRKHQVVVVDIAATTARLL
jgi:hypothetical protein